MIALYDHVKTFIGIEKPMDQETIQLAEKKERMIERMPHLDVFVFNLLDFACQVMKKNQEDKDLAKVVFYDACTVEKLLPEERKRLFEVYPFEISSKVKETKEEKPASRIKLSKEVEMQFEKWRRGLK